jgi:hypothetical protein
MSDLVVRSARAIPALIARMDALAQWLEAHRPDIKVMSLRRCDIALLQHYPEIAARHQVFINDGHIYWRSFALRAADESTP